MGSRLAGRAGADDDEVVSVHALMIRVARRATSSPAIQVRIGLTAPSRRAKAPSCSASHATRSAAAPTSRVPTSGSRSAIEPPCVAAVSASPALIPRSVAPSPTTSGIVPNPEYVPAFASLASATVAPASSSARAGGRRSRRTIAGAGSTVATVSEPAMAATPSSSSCSRWSTDAAPSRIPSSVGPGSRELLGVQAQAEARGDGRSADALGGREVEEAGIGEDVDEVGEALRGDGRDHLVRDALRMLSGGRSVGDRVRAEEGRHDANRHPIGDAPNDAEVAELFLERQAVAGLALDRRRAGGQGGTQARLAQRLERRVVGRARGGHGPQDAAAGVGSSLEARGGLVRAVAGEDRMGVAVDEARRHERGAEVDALIAVWRIARGADPRDPPVAKLDRPR